MTDETVGTNDHKEYIYDDLNRLIEVKDNGTTLASFAYDAFNRRITKTANGVVHRYSYDGWNVVEEDFGGAYQYNYIDEGMDRHLAVEYVDGNGIGYLYYLLTDERGSVVALIDPSGNIVERYGYTVYGDRLTVMDANWVEQGASSSLFPAHLSPFLWNGAYFDSETELYWMRNRYYYPDMKRFINQDPIGIWGDANNLGNGFAYVAGMVVEHSDPTGLYGYGNERGGTSDDGRGGYNFWETQAMREHPDFFLTGVGAGRTGAKWADIVDILFFLAGVLADQIDDPDYDIVGSTYGGDGVGNGQVVTDFRRWLMMVLLL